MEDSVDYTLGLVHAPIWEGQKKPGVAYGPCKMEALGLNQLLFDLGYNFKVFKNPECNDFVYGQPEQLEAKYKEVASLVHQAFLQTQLPIVIGGDHSLAMASLSSVLRHYPKAGVIWFDAHADINTFETSPSGNIHGMPVAALSGLIKKEELFSGDWMCDHMDLKQIVYLGLRDIDEGEIELLNKHGVLYYTAEQIHKGDLNKIFAEIKEHFYKYGFHQGVHLSFDIDGLSSELVPATGTPVPQGLTIEQMIQTLELIKSNFQLLSVDCVEFNPYKIDEESEVLKTYSAIQSFFTHLLSHPGPVMNRHSLEEIQKPPVLTHNNSIPV